jgi:hypothetical protein
MKYIEPAEIPNISSRSTRLIFTLWLTSLELALQLTHQLSARKSPTGR